MEMSAEQKDSFANTVARIADNLSVQRDARDLEQAEENDMEPPVGPPPGLERNTK